MKSYISKQDENHYKISEKLEGKSLEKHQLYRNKIIMRITLHSDENYNEK